MQKVFNKYFLIVLIGLFSMPSCTKGENTITSKPEDDKPVFSYDDLYKTVYEEPFEEKERLTTKARYGYILNDKQGYNSWY